MERRLSLAQLDLLKEIGTVGAGRAATALSDLIAKKVEISVPQVNLIPLEDISNLLIDREKIFLVVDMEIEGDVEGRIFILFSPNDAKHLSGGFMGIAPEQIDIKDEMFQSSIKEAVNILGGSYISAMADMTKLSIMVSPPALATDMVGAILDFIFIQIAQYSDEALYIKTNMKVSEKDVEGLFLVFPSAQSLNKIFEAAGLKEE